MSEQQVFELCDYAKNIPDFDWGTAKAMTLQEIRAAYNGCGPERWSAVTRNIADYVTEIYAAAVMVHDCDFTNSDGQEETLYDATIRFRMNTSAILSYEYPLLTWRMLLASYRLARARAVALKKILDFGVSMKFCRRAWQEAYRSRVNKETQNG